VGIVSELMWAIGKSGAKVFTDEVRGTLLRFFRPLNASGGAASRDFIRCKIFVDGVRRVARPILRRASH
jgi:hypothetical protein